MNSVLPGPILAQSLPSQVTLTTIGQTPLSETGQKEP